MMSRSTVVVAVASFAIGVALTLLVVSRSSDSRVRGGGARAPESGSSSARNVEFAALEVRLEQSEARNLELGTEVETLRARIAERESVERELEARVSGAAEDEASAPRFIYSKWEKGLRSADWEALGGATSRLMPLLSEAAEVSAGKREMRPALWGEIMAEVGPIVTGAIELDAQGVAWSNPSVLVNLVHATLREAGQPLTGPQEEDLDAIGLRFIDEDQRRLASYDDETIALQKRIDIVRLQDRAYTAIDRILNDAQRAALYPTGVRGIVGLDIFSGGTNWDEHWDPMPHEGRAGLREVVTGGYRKVLRAELAADIARIVADWEAKLPDSFVLAEPSAQRRQSNDMERSARILATADYQLTLMKAMLAQLPLSDDERQLLIATDRVYVPILD